MISKKGVAADPEKVEATKNWPQLNNITALWGFLRLTGYYQRFVQSYGKIARPMTELMKKDGFVWSVKATEAFDRLKIAMMLL